MRKIIEKSATIKIFEYFLLDKKLKAQCQLLDDTFKFNKIIKKEKPALKNYSKSYLIYSSKHSFYKCSRKTKRFDDLSLKSKYFSLPEFSKLLNKFKELKTIQQKTEMKKTKCMYYIFRIM